MVNAATQAVTWPVTRRSASAVVRRAVLALLRHWERLTPAGGEPIHALEEVFSKYLGLPHALAVSSGTAGLEVALRAAGVGAGDEVVLPAYDWGAAAGAVLRCGARPLFADVDAATATLDPASLEARITDRTVAVVVTHLAGCPADLDSILKAAQRRSLLLIEDCAQALGTQYRGRPVGSFGHAAVFSFGWGKLVSAGEGGIVVFRNGDLWRRAVGLSQHPLRQLREGVNGLGDLAMNARMHPLAAAIILAQWELWPKWLERKRAACLELSRRLSDLDGLVAPADPPHGKHSFHRYVLVLPDEAVASKLVHSLSAMGWPVYGSPIVEPLHLREPFRGDYQPGDFPHAERRCRASMLVAADWTRATRGYLRKLAEAIRGEILAREGVSCR